ncbi:nucleoporin p58/p45 [Geosmithia morbida]|uniref:Nucleoporin p58/p45 n=1 Tax=Geosmithia morbida TaxID=1094350 RepID=A0A9P4YYF6_9HYPO|nr:nucleoporin p58/p45 [Geosmithia morbida]KAF4125393.1 nucleoporin p58/p45 [Geosmithia morbida]
MVIPAAGILSLSDRLCPNLSLTENCLPDRSDLSTNPVPLSSNDTQPQLSGGLFGSNPSSAVTTSNNSNNAAPGATTTAGVGSMASAGGLFGGGGGQQTGGGGLFGNNTGGTATGGGGGLFGNNNSSNSTATGTTGTGGLFGGAANSNNQQQTGGATPAAGGLFGNAQQTAQSTGGGTGLFGNTNTQQSGTATGGGGGLFGASTANNNNNNNNNNQQQQQQQQSTQPSLGGGLFGGGQTQAKPAGGLLRRTDWEILHSGQSQAAPAQPAQQQSTTATTTTVPAVQINYDNLGPRSRFDDLAKPIQDEISLIDKGIARVIKMKDQIGEFMPQHERDIEQLGRDVKFVESKFRTVQVALNGDIQTVKALQDLTKKNIGDAQLSFKATDNLKLPAHYHQTGLFASGAGGAGGGAAAPSSSADAAAGAHTDAQDLITYFNRICDDLERYKKRLDEYRGEIERDMPGVENGLYEQIRSLRDRHAAAAAGNAASDGTDDAAAAGSVADQLGQVLYALRDMGSAIVNQAGQIADTRERLSRLQAGILDSGVYAMGMTA